MASFSRKSILYSQNFIKNPRLVAQLLDKSSIGPSDLVYEIGPGKGAITTDLAARCKYVVAIENDLCLADQLIHKFAGAANVAIHPGDFLQHPLPNKPYKVFANIPFNITSAVVARLTTAHYPPEDIYLVMQKEAASIYLGQPENSLRSVLLKPWFTPQITCRFRRTDFTPVPGVDAVMLRLCKRSPPLIAQGDRQHFRDFVVYSYTAWRPSLKEVLKGIFSSRQLAHLRTQIGIRLDVTPGAVPFESWLVLFEFFKTFANPWAARMIAGSEKRLRHQQAKLHKDHRTRVK